MAGETSLSTLLRTLQATLHPSTFVFITIPQDELSKLPRVSFSDTMMTFRESEGLTIILDLEIAQLQEYEFSNPSRMITLDVYSSLEAVGFMAVIATRLGEAGISCNPVSAFYHDHLFVPKGKEEAALRVLRSISEDAKTRNTS